MKTFNSFADFGKSPEADRIRKGRKRIKRNCEPVFVNGVNLENKPSVNARIRRVKEELGDIEIQQEFVIMFGKKTIIKHSDRTMYEQAKFTIYKETIIVKR